MLKTIITDAIVSPGYEGAPALKFSEKGDAAWLLIGKKVYASNAAGSHGVRPPQLPSPRCIAPSQICSPHIIPQPTLDSPAPEVLDCEHLL